MLKTSSDRRRIVAESPASLQGEIYGRRKFKLKRATVEGDRTSFETQAVRGISFQFSGTVLNEARDEREPIYVSLKGRLTKLMNGKKVAEAQVTFGYLEPEF